MNTTTGKYSSSFAKDVAWHIKQKTILQNISLAIRYVDEIKKHELIVAELKNKLKEVEESSANLYKKGK